MSKILSGCRKLYARVFKTKKAPFFVSRPPQLQGQEASDKIKSLLLSEEPCMIARYGSVELDCIAFYLTLQQGKMHLYNEYIKGNIPAVDWPDKVRSTMENNAGFFPSDDASLKKFSNLMIEDSAQVDVLGSWLEKEKKMDSFLKGATTIRLKDLKPFTHPNPWTTALTGKRVLVIHPFSKSIEQQYAIRKQVYPNEDLLPDFELLTYRPVQSIAGNHVNYPFKSWFEALDFMKSEIRQIDFDIAIIGCGAYGFPLASFVKQLGKKSVHLGGVTQILFGIIGKRWEEEFDLSHLINEHWIRPSNDEKPGNFKQVEDGCYW